MTTARLLNDEVVWPGLVFGDIFLIFYSNQSQERGGFERIVSTSKFILAFSFYKHVMNVISSCSLNR